MENNPITSMFQIRIIYSDNCEKILYRRFTEKEAFELFNRFIFVHDNNIRILCMDNLKRSCHYSITDSIINTNNMSRIIIEGIEKSTLVLSKQFAQKLSYIDYREERPLATSESFTEKLTIGGKEMKVSLVQASPNAAKMVADIASIYYGEEEAQNPDKLLKHLFKEKHHSVLEHVYFTFYIEGISRACLAQLTRHTSSTVESQRYVVDQSDSQVILPDTIRDNPEALRIFNEAVQDARETYQTLRLLNIPEEDARYILPEGTATREYISMTLRELIHICNLRGTQKAQWEIRDVVNRMRNLVMINNPELKFMFVPEEK